MRCEDTLLGSLNIRILEAFDSLLIGSDDGRLSLYFRDVIKRFLLSILLISGLTAFGQKQSIQDTTIRFFAIGGELGLQMPMGDLEPRFGFGGLTGGSFMFKSGKNWTLEANVGFIFGNQVKEDTILQNLMTETGIIIGRDGNPVDVFLFERGFVSTVRVGKVFPVIGPNPNCGIHLALGGGVMQHKIRIQPEFETLPQLEGDYKKGYDRLTNGFCLSQSLGYQHFGNTRFVNYYVGVEFYEGFTQNRRTINFDTQQPDTRQRLDVIGSLVVRWYFPIYKRQARDYYFY